MRLLGSRQVLVWTVVPLIVAQMGCAGRGLRVPSPPPPAGASEAPRVACEESAHAKTDGPRHAPPRKPTAGEWVGLALILVITSPITVPMLPFAALDQLRTGRGPREARHAESTTMRATADPSARGDAGVECAEQPGPPSVTGTEPTMPPKENAARQDWNPGGSPSAAWGWADRVKRPAMPQGPIS